MADSLFGFAFGGQIQSHCGLDCLGNHKYSIVWCWVCRYTSKERDDSSGLYYYGARYLAPWLTRWISPDAAGAVDGLNLYIYVDNNPLKYIMMENFVLAFNKLSLLAG
jgi:RHS repeat-associated protein